MPRETLSLLPYLITAFAVTAFGNVSDANPPSPISADQFQAIIAERCHQCHGGEKTKGKLDLVALTQEDDLRQDAELLETMLAVLHDGEMPPEDEPSLAEGEREQLTAYLEGLLSEAQSSEPFEPTPISRLNRFQYNNAIVDLLGLTRDVFWMPERMLRRRSDYFKPAEGKMSDTVRVQNRPLGKDHDGERPEGFKDVAAFPQDRRAEHGFDNRADHLTLSPLLMEQFLQLSHSIVESKDLNPKESRTWDNIFTQPNAGEPIAIIRERLTKFLRRAFRRPVEAKTLDRFVAFAAKELESGASFTDTMKTLVGATIASPNFLYLYNVEESSDPAERQKIDDFELASRLSFFLWVSIPDDTLLAIAEAGKLSDPEVLASQIDRMLVDVRTSRFCEIFPGQWLQLDRLVSSIPNPEKYAYFYYLGYRASMHMMMEPLLLFETAYIEDRSVIDLLNPKFTWQTDHLRTAYEGTEPKDQSTQTLVYKRIPMDDPKRGGIITNAAVMTMTSDPEHTLPITRGAWVNTVIFNDPPEPPPADVPPLPEADEEALSKLTIRERFAEHRKREDCRGCHRQIDPLGFALENYGPTGMWRDQYPNGREIDPSGNVFGKYEFETVVDFKQIILKEKRRFVRGFAAHLLSFALGRELGPADSPALDRIADRAMAGEDSLRSIMKMVAMSEPFFHKSTNYEAARLGDHPTNH
ncbi:DUF1592 domain-containing protein [Verrucomicrobiales bacterium]|nr:DUF1592 domain-containing protein [Verrucomicrobiales bacterium]MDB4632427.1 DUF1592 domain-containing protein [bacterium]